MGTALLPTATLPRVSHPPKTFAPVGGRTVLAVTGLFAVGWAYWPVMVAMAERWIADPQFSHGWIVPLIAGYLLWDRRQVVAHGRSASAAWGLILTLLGLTVWVAGTVLFLPWVGAMSLPVTLLGLVACWGGRAGVRWAGPGVAFLLFMAPPPYQVQTASASQLQRLGTAATVFGLQTLGISAFPEGNVVVLDNGARLGVLEACSGLGMAMTLLALTTAAALLVRAPLWQRVVVAVSAVPVAVATNVLQLLATGVLASESPSAADMFHEHGGWLMMPVAAGLIAAEFWVLRRLVVPGNPA